MQPQEQSLQAVNPRSLKQQCVYLFSKKHRKVTIITLVLVAIVEVILIPLTLHVVTSSNEKIYLIIAIVLLPLTAIGILFGSASSHITQEFFKKYAALRGYDYSPTGEEGLEKVKRTTVNNLSLSRFNEYQSTTNLLTKVVPGIGELSFYHERTYVKNEKHEDTNVVDFSVATLPFPFEVPHLLMLPSFHYTATYPSLIHPSGNKWPANQFTAVQQYAPENQFTKSFTIFSEASSEVIVFEIINPADMEYIVSLRGITIELRDTWLSISADRKFETEKDLDNFIATLQKVYNILGPTLSHMAVTDYAVQQNHL